MISVALIEWTERRRKHKDASGALPDEARGRGRKTTEVIKPTCYNPCRRGHRVAANSLSNLLRRECGRVVRSRILLQIGDEGLHLGDFPHLGLQDAIG